MNLVSHIIPLPSSHLCLQYLTLFCTVEVSKEAFYIVPGPNLALGMYLTELTEIFNWIRDEVYVVNRKQEDVKRGIWKKVQGSVRMVNEPCEWYYFQLGKLLEKT